MRFPDVISARLRVAHIGNSSVSYEVGIFKQGDIGPVVFGYFVHVFVDRQTNKSTPIPPAIHAALQKLLISG
ncbi:MAG: acyl-CoA thioesterase [Chloroflexota bacterium]